MKEKKEFYLNFLKDNSINEINKSISINKNEESSNNININNSNIKNYIIEKNGNNYSFENFISSIKNYDFTNRTKWDNPGRVYAMNIDKNKNLVKLTELNQINFCNPLLILNKEYIQENYNPYLFESELTNIDNILKINKSSNQANTNKKNKNNINDNSYDDNIFIEKIMEKRENLEIHKKILNYYLQYYCQNNFELMSPSMKKIRELTNIVDLYYEKLHSKKKKSLIMKNFIIGNSMKLILKKKKFENLRTIYIVLNNKILAFYKDIKKLKLKTMNFNYIKYYEENNRLINEIESIEKNMLRKFKKNNNNQKNEIKINIIEDIKKKLIRKKEKLKKIYNTEKNNIFESKKSNIIDLYYLFNIEHNIQNNKERENESSLFVNEMKKNFKITSKKIILEMVQYFKNKENTNQNLNSIIIFNLNKPKLSDINKVYIDEKNLIPFFLKIFIKLNYHLEVFLYYYNLICSEQNDLDKNKSFKNEIKYRKNEFYEIIDKHISKIIILLNNDIEKEEEADISKINLLIILNIICLFEKLLKIKLSVKYNKYINSVLKNFLINKIKHENKKVVEKAINLIPKDTLDKNVLNSSFFQIELIKQRIPFHLKKFITFFNESEIKESLISKLITKYNIDDIFNYIKTYYDNINLDNNNEKNIINFDEVLNLFCKEEINKYKKEIENENDIIIFNKPLNYSTSFITNSSCHIIKGIEDQIINLIIFESLIYEIFIELFDIIDLYIFISFKIFLKDNNCLSILLKNLDITEFEKDIGNIVYWSDIVSYQKKYLELKKFYFLVEKKFCEFFSENREFSTEEERQTYINNIISKLIGIENEIKEEKEKNILSQSYNNIKNFNIFSININRNKNSKENKDSNNDNNIDNIIKKDGKDNINIDKNKITNEENEDDIEPLNINQINEVNNISSNSKEKDKNEGLKFFNFFRSSNDNNNQEITIDELIKEIKLKLTTIKFKEITIIISSILTLNKILKRLVSFTTKIDLELQRYHILNKINKYEKIIEQIRDFFYENISLEILDFTRISNLILDFNWSPNPEEGSTQLFEASNWVKKLKSLFEIIVCEIHNKYNELFGEKKLSEFFNNLIRYIIENIEDSFSKIKKCNDMGRSIMLKDIKLLKEGIDNTLKKYNYIKKIKTNFLFDILIQYTNAWYYNNEELEKFVINYNIKYKYFESLINSSPTINELSYDIKNELINKVKQNFLSKFKKFASSFKDEINSFIL